MDFAQPQDVQLILGKLVLDPCRLQPVERFFRCIISKVERAVMHRNKVFCACIQISLHRLLRRYVLRSHKPLRLVSADRH